MKTPPHPYFEKAFPGLAIRQPLFYNWELSLRFDTLEVTGSPHDATAEAYFREVNRRAIRLFEACFSQPQMEVLLLIHKAVWKNNSIGTDDFIIQQIQQFDPQKLHIDQITALYDPEYEHDIWHRGVYETTLGQLNVEALIQGICNTDFPNRKPFIKEELYFINPIEHIIFQIYDDRGLDIVMMDKAKLTAYYRAFSDWILADHRKLILKRIA